MRLHIHDVGKKAYAYRNKQFRFSEQIFDIYVDSLDPAYYLAFECKSIDADKNKVLYFKKYFASSNKGHQIEREHMILQLTGRNGFLVVEARRCRPLKPVLFFVPFRTVVSHFLNDKVGIPSEVITQSPAIERAQGRYSIDSDFMDELFNTADRRYPVKRKKEIRWKNERLRVKNPGSKEDKR